MKQTSTCISVAAIACGVAFAQSFDTVTVPAPGPAQVIRMRSGAIGGAIGTAQFGLMGPAVKGAPYSAEGTTESTQVLADGTHIHHQESYTIYRDGEGRIRRESGDEAWISDPVASETYVLDTKQQTARKIPLSRTMAFTKMEAEKGATTAGVAVMAGPVMTQSFAVMGTAKGMISPQQGKTESLGKQEMEGVAVEGTRTTMVIPEGQIGNDRQLQIVHERWESPELQVTVMAKHSDPLVGDHVERLTSIRRGEPDPSLFQVPAGYQVLTAAPQR